MGRAPKALGLLICCALIGTGCGDDESSTSTNSSAATTTQEPEGEARGASTENGQAVEPKKNAPAGHEADSRSGKSDSRVNAAPPSATDEAAEAKSFSPKSHDDSGGGSEQTRVRGGDNSIQEFGEEASDSEFARASESLHNFLDARAAANWAAACSYLSEDVVKSFEQLASRAKGLRGAGCGALLESFTSKAAMGLLRKEAEAADVVSLREDGERAFVIYRGVDEAVYAIPMANEDGEWKVAAIAGTPIG